MRNVPRLVPPTLAHSTGPVLHKVLAQRCCQSRPHTTHGLIPRLVFNTDPTRDVAQHATLHCIKPLKLGGCQGEHFQAVKHCGCHRRIKQFETKSYWHAPVEEGLAVLMEFAPSLRNTVVEFGFASVLRVSANVSSQILVGRRVWKDLQHAPVSLNKTRCVMMWPTCVVRQELRPLDVEVQTDLGQLLCQEVQHAGEFR